MSNILHITSGVNLQSGTVSKLYRYIVSSKENNHIIYCWTNWHGNENFIKNKLKFDLISVPVINKYLGRNIFFHWILLYRIIRKNNISIVHNYYDSGLIISMPLKIFFKDLKYIFSFVGSFNPNKLVIKLLLNFLYKSVNLIVYNSNYTKETKESFFNSLKTRKSVVLYNSIIINKYESITYKKIGSNLKLLSIGTAKVKNIDVVFRCLPSLIEEIGDSITYTIIGESNYNDCLKDLAAELKITKYVRFLGYIDNIYPYIDNCDIFLHPSKNEAFGIAVIEAMSRAKPIIAADAGAIPELIKNGKHGYLVDPEKWIDWKNSILRMIHDRKRNHMCKNARGKAIRFFSHENYVKTLDYLYNNV